MLASAQASFGFNTPIVASNMNLNGNAALEPFVGPDKTIQATRIQELENGLKVAYIGLMGRGAALGAPFSAPVRFTDPTTQYAAIQTLIDTLRKRGGVDIVIALSHSGNDRTGTSGEDVELARHVTGIDVIASGHTHTPLASARTVVNGTWSTHIIDAGAFGTNVSRIDLSYRRPTKTATLLSSSNVAMTDASLNAIHAGLVGDAHTTA